MDIKILKGISTGLGLEGNGASDIRHATLCQRPRDVGKSPAEDMSAKSRCEDVRGVKRGCVSQRGIDLTASHCDCRRHRVCIYQPTWLSISAASHPLPDPSICCSCGIG